MYYYLVGVFKNPLVKSYLLPMLLLTLFILTLQYYSNEQQTASINTVKEDVVQALEGKLISHEQRLVNMEKTFLAKLSTQDVALATLQQHLDRMNTQLTSMDSKVSEAIKPVEPPVVITTPPEEPVVQKPEESVPPKKLIAGGERIKGYIIKPSATKRSTLPPELNF